MAEEFDQERTLPATQRRLEQAREEGQVARSRELGTCLVLTAAAAACWWLGPHAAEGLSGLVRAGLVFDHAGALDARRMLGRLDAATWQGFSLALPWLALTALAAAGAAVAVGGVLFSAKAATPDFNRMNPASGFARMFSAQSLAELAKAIGKSLLITAATAGVLWTNRDLLMSLGALAPEAGIAGASRVMALAFLLIAASTALIAAADVPWQLWRHAKSLRMSLEEVRRELRESEGDPQIRMRIRSQQRELARRRMMAEVPGADVVVTNPTHYAVALAYRAGQRAPKVVASGRHLVAQRIREVAQAAGVPVFEAPPLARALYRHAELGAEIPWQLYEAVALVLAWVAQVRLARSSGGRLPRAPGELPVPAAWGAEEEGA